MRFVNNHDPNLGSSGTEAAFNWPQYTPGSPQILEFLDGDVPLQVGQDTYREAALAYDMDVSTHNTR